VQVNNRLKAYKFTRADVVWWARYGRPQEWLKWQRLFDQPGDAQLSRWHKKYNKIGNSPTDPNVARMKNFWLGSVPPKQEKLTTDFAQNMGWDDHEVPHIPKHRPTWLKAKEMEDKFVRVAGAQAPKLLISPIPELAPYHRPVYNCFATGDAGAGAKLQIAEKNFKPAELPPASELQFWEDRLNKIADESDGYIVRQDRNGNLTGTKLYTPRTSVDPRRQEELDQAMERRIAIAQQQDLRAIEEMRAKVGDGVSEHDVARFLLSAIPERLCVMLLMDQGMTAREAGKRIGKSRENTKKMRQRDVPTPIISEAVAKRDPQCRGWHIVVKLPYRDPYLYKLDCEATASEDKIEVAINLALHKEGTRLFMNAIRDAGIVKTMPNSKLNAMGKEIVRKSWERTCEAFDKGKIVFICCVAFPGCTKPECKELTCLIPGWQGFLPDLSDAA